MYPVPTASDRQLYQGVLPRLPCTHTQPKPQFSGLQLVYIIWGYNFKNFAMFYWV